VSHPLEQPLDLIEHRVDVAGELVVLVARAAQRRSPAQVTRHDLTRGPVQVGEPAAGTERHEHAARYRERHREREPIDRSACEQLLDLRELAYVAADEQTQPGADADQSHAYRRALAAAARLDEVQPLTRQRVELLRQIGQVARERPADRVREQIDGAVLLVAAHTLRDHVCEAARAAALVLL
jgi:hypothetical protein